MYTQDPAGQVSPTLRGRIVHAQASRAADKLEAHDGRLDVLTDDECAALVELLTIRSAVLDTLEVLVLAAERRSSC